MSNIIIFLSYFYILLLSVIGYGIFFQNLCFGRIKDMNDSNVIYTGFYGLFTITFISIISSLIVPHNFTHNILLHIVGVMFFEESSFGIKAVMTLGYLLSFLYNFNKDN